MEGRFSNSSLLYDVVNVMGLLGSGLRADYVRHSIRARDYGLIYGVLPISSFLRRQSGL